MKEISKSVNEKIVVKNKNLSCVKTTSIDKTNFIVVLDLQENKKLWLSENKFLEICALLEKSKDIEYPLKKAFKGNVDEGKDPQDGKAVKIVRDDKYVNIFVYLQTFGESWAKDNEYQLDLELFDAYKTVMLNNVEVEIAEKEVRKPRNFSLNLPS